MFGIHAIKKKRVQKKAPVEEEEYEEKENNDSESPNTANNDSPAWLESLVQEELAPAPRKKTLSKQPKKKAKQLFPFECTRCSAKYKTKTNLWAHLRERHGMLS